MTPIAVGYMEENQNCSVERFNRSVELAEQLVDIGADDVIVFYDERDDYMVVGFVFFGRSYWVRSYKVYRLRKGAVGEFDDFGISFDSRLQVISYLISHERDF